MNDVSDLRGTIVPKSDQLNAEQLLGGPMTVSVTDVRLGNSDEQPVVVHYEGEAGRPYKPCKTMRKVLIFAWGEDGRKWIGRSMTLYNDPSIKFGGMDVGGIRISHMSHIDGVIKVSLTATKGKKALHTIGVLKVAAPVVVDHMAAITSAPDIDDLKTAFKTAFRSTKDAAQQAQFKAAYDARMQALLDAEDAAISKATGGEA